MGHWVQRERTKKTDDQVRRLRFETSISAMGSSVDVYIFIRLLCIGRRQLEPHVAACHRLYFSPRRPCAFAMLHDVPGWPIWVHVLLRNAQNFRPQRQPAMSSRHPIIWVSKPATQAQRARKISPALPQRWVTCSPRPRLH